MKSILWRALMSLGIAVTACFGTRQEEGSAALLADATGPAPTTTTTTTCRAEMPPIQQRLNLRTWRWGQRFYPTDVTSAYTVVVTSPIGFPGYFVAYGFDVQRGTTPFAVVGPLADQPRFESWIQQEVGALPGHQSGVMSLLIDVESGPTAPPGSDGGSEDDGGTPPEAPPIGKNEETGEPNVDEPIVARPAFDLAVMRHEAVTKGTLKPKSMQLKLGN